MGISTVTTTYGDGVSSPSLSSFSPVSLTFEDGNTAYTTTAKHLGNGDSPSNYYQTGGGISISPADWRGFIPNATGSGDTWDKATFVFSVYPVTLLDANYYIFGSESGNIIVGNWDENGGIWFGARAWNNAAKSIHPAPVGSPSDYGGMVPGQWNSIMIAVNGDGSSSPEVKQIKIWSNGVEIYSGEWDTDPAANHPTSFAGYSWVGRGDGFAGATEDGMHCYLSHVWINEEYLDPATYWSSFFDGDNKPIDLGADGSTPTGSQPHIFCPNGDFSNNLGSGDNWDEIGTVPDAPSSPTD